jgi:hypothetical protein
MPTNCILAAALLTATALAALPAVEEKKADAAPRDVSIKVVDGAIEFRHGDALTTRYHIAPTVAKPYFWPLNSPSGVPTTRPWPMDPNVPAEEAGKKDHVHQKSAWFCHGDVIPEGIELKQKIKGVEGVDFWSEAPGHGVIVCTKVGTPVKSGSRAAVSTDNEWRTADGMKILDEKRTISFHDLGAAQLLVLDITLTASACPITFGDTKEGSLGVRVRESMTEGAGKGGVLVNAEGNRTEGKNSNKEMTGCWGVPSAWCDYSGPADGKTVGVAIFADPTNPYPTCWHSRGYGLHAANPFGRAKSGFPAMKGKNDLVKIPKSGTLKLRYGILIHDGDVKDAKVADLYAAFVKMK